MNDETAASSLISRSNAAHDTVHDYALEQLSSLEGLIARVKARIQSKRDAAAQATADYISSVDESLRAARILEDSILDLEAKVPGPVVVQPSETKV